MPGPALPLAAEDLAMNASERWSGEADEDIFFGFIELAFASVKLCSFSSMELVFRAAGWKSPWRYFSKI